jgi:nucleotide-binding universal stress UspA family protein
LTFTKEEYMPRILLAVDDTISTREMFNRTMNLAKCMAPEEIILLYVEKFEGRSLMDEMLGDAEMQTLHDALMGTEFKQALDAKAGKILAYYKDAFEASPPVPLLRTMVKTGHPAEQIVATAKQENVDLIFIGSKGKRVSSLLMGSVSREVVNTADRPVLVVK